MLYIEISQMKTVQSRHGGGTVKVVIAIDSLKGSLTSLEAGYAAAEGVRRANPEAKIVVRPLADGGEGTVDALVQGMGGEYRKVEVTGPLGMPVDCTYGVIPESETAVIEMAGASGITLVKPEDRNPLLTTTYGLGEVIRDAIHSGCRKFIIGIGGSATNDGGAGMLQALGIELLDSTGKQIQRGAIGLRDLVEVRTEHSLPELSDCRFLIACDVTNPLCGSDGCSAIYGPQKGADKSMIRDMDRWLGSYASITKRLNPDADPDWPGAGAAGGLGFAFLAYLQGKLQSGIQLVLDETHLKDYVKDADVVVTGEGRLDHQTAMGKAPIGVAKLAKKYGARVVAFAGSVTQDAVACNRAGIDAFFPIVRGVCSLNEAMDPENAKKNMTDTAEQVFRLIKD
jgi:glycerate kinase